MAGPEVPNVPAMSTQTGCLVRIAGRFSAPDDAMGNVVPSHLLDRHLSKTLDAEDTEATGDTEKVGQVL